MVKLLSKPQPYFLLAPLAFLLLACNRPPDLGCREKEGTASGYQADTAKVNLLVKKALNEAKNNLDLSLVYADSAIVLSRQTEYKKGEAEALFSKGWIYRIMKNTDSGLYYIRTARALFDELHDQMGLINSNNVYGMFMRSSGNHDSAIMAFNVSLKISKQLNDSSKIGKIYNLIGLNYHKQAEFDSAAHYYYLSLDILHHCRDYESEVVTSINLSTLFMEIREYDKALSYSRRCLSYLHNAGSSYKLCQQYISIGQIFSEAGSLDSSEFYHWKALEIAEQNNYTHLIAMIYSNLSKFYDIRKDYAKVRECIEKAYPIYKELNDKEGLLSVYSKLGVNYERVKRYDLSLAYYDSAYVLAQKLDAKDLILGLYYNIYWVYKYREDYPNALLNLEKYIKLNDSIYNEKLARTVTENEVRYAKQKDQAEILSLEKKNLEKDILIKTARTRRDISLAGGGFVLIVSLFALAFFRQRAGKDRIIAEQKLLKAEEEKKALAARSLVEGQEEERVRVARELHDGIGMLISTTIRQFEAAAGPQGANPELILKAKAGMEKANEDVRRISRNLMPTVLSLYGLEEALDDLIEGINSISGMYAAFHSDGQYVRIPLNREIMVYRIVQELINNTVKHAGAESVLLKLNQGNGNLVVTYSDDGKGFDYNEKLKARSVGLKSIQSRLDFLGGTMEVESEPGNGTVFRLKVPVETGNQG